MGENEKQMTFWDHLDELRGVIFKVGATTVILAVVAFIAKDIVFNVIFAPLKSDFPTYHFLDLIDKKLPFLGLGSENFHLELMNIELTGQFLIHLSTSLYVGLILASPYVIYKIYGFISPALYETERKISARIITVSFILFMIGIIVNYYIIFPFSLRFLASYQVSEIVENRISLASYMGMFMTLSFMMGVVFEIPIVTFFLSKLGIVTKNMLKKFRRHALVVILIIAAIITPTTDIFTLLLVTAPMYLLYEISILVVRKPKEETN